MLALFLDLLVLGSLFLHLGLCSVTVQSCFHLGSQTWPISTASLGLERENQQGYAVFEARMLLESDLRGLPGKCMTSASLQLSFELEAAAGSAGICREG